MTPSSTDCFGNPSEFPPSIADSHADIARFASVPVLQRLDYASLRAGAMVGQVDKRAAWAAYADLCAMVSGGGNDA